MANVRRRPQRTCVGCGEMKDKSELIRVLRTPEGTWTLDRTGRKNGRGAYLCRNPECLEKAARRHSLDRSFRTAVPSEVYDMLREEITES